MLYHLVTYSTNDLFLRWTLGGGHTVPLGYAHQLSLFSHFIDTTQLEDLDIGHFISVYLENILYTLKSADLYENSYSFILLCQVFIRWRIADLTHNGSFQTPPDSDIFASYSRCYCQLLWWYFSLKNPSCHQRDWTLPWPCIQINKIACVGKLYVILT